METNKIIVWGEGTKSKSDYVCCFERPTVCALYGTHFAFENVIYKFLRKFWIRLRKMINLFAKLRYFSVITWLVLSHEEYSMKLLYENWTRQNRKQKLRENYTLPLKLSYTYVYS